MTPPGTPGESRSETLYSEALLQKRITVREMAGARGRGLSSGTRLKAILFPLLHWSFRHSPRWLALLPIQLPVALLRLLYGWKSNPLRRGCEAVSRIAAAHGHRHPPRQLYRRFLDNVTGVMKDYFQLYRHGVEAVSSHIELADDDARLIRDLAGTHGGVVLAVPHNIASAIAALRLNRSFPLVVVARNSPTIARTRIALDFFERMEVPVLMVRGGNPFELSRTLFSILREGRVIAATLDNIDNSSRRVAVEMFGQDIGLAPWAAKIAARMQLPVVPCWFRSDGRRIAIVMGEPLQSDDATALVQHYADFFERNILADPASWAYLVDKHWCRLLEQAADAWGTPDHQ
ncbi:MAG TPA: hypothetical protein ENK05_00625 [Gammaproteobacteria bacterium]|nr:hypothetical protein [Gammaproteobacteria bacterium]